MPKEFTLKDIGEEAQLIRRRIYFASFFMLFLLLLIVLRVFYLQVIMHDHFTTLSQQNRVKILPIPPIRGLIFSQDGILLAENRPSFSLELVPEQIDRLGDVVNRLGKMILIEETDISRFQGLLKKKRRFESIPLRFNLSEDEVAQFAVNRHLFPGVDIRARLNRYYPLGAGVVHAVGYVGRIDENDLKSLDTTDYSGSTHTGKSGVEKAYEEILHGKVGYQQVEVNAQGRIIRVLDKTAPKPGQNLHLTLNISLQRVAVDALKGKRGAIVAINPENGDVLAMVSSPGYDPNPFVNGIDEKSYNQLLLSNENPLINRVMQGKYPPGSTIKPFLGLIALNSGMRHLADETWCPGWYSLQGSEHRYRDWKKYGHGYTGLKKAITQSCDVYFYNLAHDLGINRIQAGLSDFGFGKETGIDIGGETGAVLPSRDWKQKTFGQPWYPGETLIMGIGQGYMLVTPLQLAKATAALASHGMMMKPRLIAEIRDAITDEVISVPGLEKQQIVIRNPAFWGEIISAMEDVVHGPGGTARQTGLDAKYRFAGKTGTAQVIGIAQDEEYKKEEIPDEFQDHALFIAFAPVGAPKIAVAIIVENGGGGSRTAAPIARRLFDHYLLEQNNINS
ncbi:MAG: penicillin-binding protein 2 [Gammaproteobacteria bacterium RBG_16_51_14]|nr:MAG: penicillin-binding protein 2 [Gammaproteobacteria bacterium RBG_16_51_14]